MYILEKMYMYIYGCWNINLYSKVDVLEPFPTYCKNQKLRNYNYLFISKWLVMLVARLKIP